jgi:hypothetical protein
MAGLGLGAKMAGRRGGGRSMGSYAPGTPAGSQAGLGTRTMPTGMSFNPFADVGQRWSNSSGQIWGGNTGSDENKDGRADNVFTDAPAPVLMGDSRAQRPGGNWAMPSNVYNNYAQARTFNPWLGASGWMGAGAAQGMGAGAAQAQQAKPLSAAMFGLGPSMFPF